MKCLIAVLPPYKLSALVWSFVANLQGRSLLHLVCPPTLFSVAPFSVQFSPSESDLTLFPPFHSVVSPIDGKSMESITSVKIFHGSEYKANGKVIRWTEVSQSN